MSVGCVLRRFAAASFDRSFQTRHVKLDAGAAENRFQPRACNRKREKKLDDDCRNKTCGKTCYRLTLRERRARAIPEDQ